MVTRLAVSNIAWRPEEADAALDMLCARGVPGIEIAPGLTFPSEPDPFRPNTAVVDQWRSGLDRRALTLVSMQSLLFGRSEAALFGDADQLGVFEAGMHAAIDLAGGLGCPNLVFGSPAARRVPGGMEMVTAVAIASDVFGRLGDRCRATGSVLAVEPVPSSYGTNFLNTFAETANFVRALDHSAVRVNLDLGALIANAETERFLEHLPAWVGLIGHVHISEPNLAPAPSDMAALARVLNALAHAGRDGWVSIEMLAADGDNVARLKSCVVRAQTAIGGGPGATG